MESQYGINTPELSSDNCDMDSEFFGGSGRAGGCSGSGGCGSGGSGDSGGNAIDIEGIAN